MTSDPLDILVAHNHWGTAVLIDQCRSITDEQFHRRFAIGPGSLHDTIEHIIGCVEAWTARVRGVPWAKSDDRQTLDELRRRLDASTEGVRQLIADLRRANEFPRVATHTFPSSAGGTVEVKFTAGAAITHCLVHGSHHRAQALNMLRQLDLGTALPELDVMDWHFETEN